MNAPSSARQNRSPQQDISDSAAGACTGTRRDTPPGPGDGLDPAARGGIRCALRHAVFSGTGPASGFPEHSNLHKTMILP